MELKTIFKIVLTKFIIKFDRNYPKVLQSKKFKFLLDWINIQTPLLQDKKYKVSTKIFWILNDIQNWSHPAVCCKQCGKPLFFKNVFRNKNSQTEILSYINFCSSKCRQNNPNVRLKNKQTCLEKYGVEFAIKSEYVKEQSKQTCLKKYGVDVYTKTQEFHIKKAQTKLERYGNPNYFNLEKRNATNLERYGNICSMNGKEQKIKANQTKLERYSNVNFINHEQAKQTRLEKYGDENYNNREQAKQTCLEKYGVENPNQCEAIKQKSKQTCIEKYGVDHPMKNSKIRIKCSNTKYIYDSIKFDSAPELAFYIWLKDNNIEFEYQPNVNLTYIYKNKKHNVLPDFKVENKLYEIKGDHFIKDDGTWQCPYNHLADDVYEAKHQCLIKNNVIILTSKDYIKYINYIIQKYGKMFLQQCKQKIS